MNLNERLISALENIAPTFPDTCTESLATYIVFNYNTLPVDFADDAPGHVRHLVQVHLYCPTGEDSMGKRFRIRSALLDAGFTWPSELNITTEKVQHHVFECEYLEEACRDWRE